MPASSTLKRYILWILSSALAVTALVLVFLQSDQRNGGVAPQEPALRVVLIPADGGTADGTLADHRPVFAELSRATGLQFSLTATQSSGAAVQALCSGAADIAFLGPASFLAGRERGCIELLAMGVRQGQALYYSIILVQKDSPIQRLQDLKGRRLAVGDIHSTSSFQMPLIMLLEAGVNPARDLAAVRVSGSHPESLSALLHGHVDAAALSLNSYERALRNNVPGAAQLRILARSEPLPYPPFVMSTRLSPEIRARLVRGFRALASGQGGTKRALVGYAGDQLDGYLVDVSDEPFNRLAARLSRLTPEMRTQVLARAGQQEFRQ